MGIFGKAIRAANVVVKEAGAAKKAAVAAKSPARLAAPIRRNVVSTITPSAAEVASARSTVRGLGEDGALSGLKRWGDIRREAYDTRSHGWQHLESAARDMDRSARGRIPAGSDESREFIFDELGRRAAWWEKNSDWIAAQGKRASSPNPRTSMSEAGLRTTRQNMTETFRNTSLDGLFDD
jgi:hypothetical protein